MILNAGGSAVGDYLPLTGGAMTGAVALYSGSSLSATPTAGLNNNTIISTQWHHNQFYLAEVTTDNISVGADNVATNTVNVAKSGYTPIGIAGVGNDNASSSGALSSFTYLTAWYLSGTDAYIKVRNYYTSAAKIKIRIIVLYRRAI